MTHRVLFIVAVGLAVASGQNLNCVALKPTPFCLDNSQRQLMPAKVCSTSNAEVTSAAAWDVNSFNAEKTNTCPKTPGAFTKNIYCQTNFIPCTEGLACPTTTKLCYSICLSGGTTGGHTFLPPATCQTGDPTTYCNQRVTNGEVASVEDTAAGKCVGLDYFNKYNMIANTANRPFQPLACNGRFPIFNVEMIKFNAEMRAQFMMALTARLNKIWGYSSNEVPQKFTRPADAPSPTRFNIRLRRVQLKNELVQVHIQMKEFCLLPLRTGAPDWSLRYNQDKYCDKISISPVAVFQNLTKILESKREDRGMIIGTDFNIRKSPTFPEGAWPEGQCYTWQPDEEPSIPGYVWALTAVGAMCCLLSTLILQHKYRNRASYVRLNEKLRSYV